MTFSHTSLSSQKDIWKLSNLLGGFFLIELSSFREKRAAAESSMIKEDVKSKQNVF